MLVETYKPATVDAVIGNKKAISDITAWFSRFSKGTGMIVAGPVGCGKTLAIELVAQQLGYEIVRTSADEVRNGMPTLTKTSQQQSLFFKKKLLLIDEFESLASIAGSTDLIKNRPLPVVIITDDLYQKNLYTLRKLCAVVSFQKPRYDTIAKFLQHICEEEHISFEKRALDQLAKMCNGDIRAALLDLETLGTHVMMQQVTELAERTQATDIFNTLKIIFKTQQLDNAMLAANNSEKDTDDVVAWVGENLPEEYKESESLATAYEKLSRADITAARIIRQQSWSLQKYITDLAICGVALSKAATSHAFTRYHAPPFYSRKRHASLVEKIAKTMHLSQHRAQHELKTVQRLVQANPELRSDFGFEKTEIEELKTI
ncbi:MAG: AAA family ATPase [Candidatus Aenigmarchaeota archaeon]|nr:AAA family ATPase [Candidatus Aenigmarchaeota archaeon]